MSNYPNSIFPDAERHHTVAGQLAEFALFSYIGYGLLFAPDKHIRRFATGNVFSVLLIASIIFSGYDEMTTYLIGAHLLIYIWAIPNKVRVIGHMPRWALPLWALVIVVPFAIVVLSAN
jgi:hypothetical protein